MAHAPLVKFFLDHDAVTELKDIAGLFELVARGTYREGISSEDMPALAFLANLMLEKAQAASAEWYEAFELAKGVGDHG